MSKVVFLIFIFLALPSSPIFSQEQVPEFITDSLDIYAKSQQEKWKIPGMAIAIIKDGKVIKTFTNGVTDYKSNSPIDQNTLFMIGSNTKAFTGILTATLAVEDNFSLQDPVKKWLPYFKMYDPYLTEHTNIIDILSHRVGFETFQGDFLNFDNELTSKEIIEKFALIKPSYGFREKWGYFNTGYTIAGEIILHATGKSWASQLDERIFNPLEMNRTLALSKEINTATNKAKAHTIIENNAVEIAYGDIDATAPAGSISSSITDMSKWVITLLANGTYNNTQVIPKEAINETITPRSIRGSASNPFRLYGLGWDIEKHNEHTFVMHTGGIHGFVTSVTMVPEENLGVVILTNTDTNYLFESLKFDIINEFLDGTERRLSDLYYMYYVNSKEAEKKEKNHWLAEVALMNDPDISLDNFTGVYSNEVYGDVNIEKLATKLVVTFQHHKDLKVTLSHTSNNNFYAEYNNPLYGTSIFPFNLKNGTVERFTLKLDPQIENTTYDFYKK